MVDNLDMLSSCDNLLVRAYSWSSYLAHWEKQDITLVKKHRYHNQETLLKNHELSPQTLVFFWLRLRSDWCWFKASYNTTLTYIHILWNFMKFKAANSRQRSHRSNFITFARTDVPYIYLQLCILSQHHKAFIRLHKTSYIWLLLSPCI